MSKRNKKQQQHAVNTANTAPSVDTATTFGFEEMLSELEAIVIDAENRQAEEAAAA